MNRNIGKRLNALEARLLSPAVDTKPSTDGFDFDEYQRLMVEVVSHDGWWERWQLSLREWVTEQQGKQKVLIFGKGYFLESD